MLPRVRTRHGEVTAELAWSGSDSRSEITPVVGRTVHLPPPPPHHHHNIVSKALTYILWLIQEIFLEDSF
ncbi:hypothetical protein Hanom_Chr10g00936381 [Helianthus anomalus]